MGLKKGITYPPLFVGLLLLLTSLILAYFSMYSTFTKEKFEGTLEPGESLLGQASSIVQIVDGNLTLFSEDAKVTVSWGRKYESLELKNNSVTLTNITDFPRVITDSQVTYTLEISGYSYPYSWISLIAFVTMITGSMLSLLGFASYLQGEIEKVKKEKKKDTTGGDDV
ncbi:MAG: hypothetical protein PWP39_437 [Pyrococcus sp.]|uniref:hypothetical protein n=1 Tax=Pyrococcus sp. TaxID=33866 RepID=UPI002589E583|nr:hypothetical protein [Pyrococcus sp.]MDK2869202.1 hypothetical protein [Pyrococcus sp.]